MSDTRCHNCTAEEAPIEVPNWVGTDPIRYCERCNAFLKANDRDKRAQLVRSGIILPAPRPPLRPDEPLPDHWIQKPTFRLLVAGA